MFDAEDLVASETRSRFKEAKLLLVSQRSPPSPSSYHCCSQEEKLWHHDRMDGRAAALASELTIRKDGCVRHSTDARDVAMSEDDSNQAQGKISCVVWHRTKALDRA